MADSAGSGFLVPAGAEVVDGASPGTGIDPTTLSRNIPADTVSVGLPPDEAEPEPVKIALDPDLRKAPLPEVEEKRSADE